MHSEEKAISRDSSMPVPVVTESKAFGRVIGSIVSGLSRKGELVRDIVRPANRIPIEKSLTGRKLVLHFGETAVVLSAHEARTLAYALLVEAETLQASP